MKVLVMLSGKLRSGKNTVSSFIQEGLSTRYTVEEKLIARNLKENCAQDFRNLSAFLRSEWERLSTKLPKEERESFSWMDVKNEHFFEDKTPFTRHLLQIYGLEIFKSKVDPLYWVKGIAEEVLHSKSDVVLITDCRFPEEIGYMESFFGPEYVVSIRIERPLGLNEEGRNHESETALDGYNGFDLTLYNDGGLNELKDKTKKAILLTVRALNG